MLQANGNFASSAEPIDPINDGDWSTGARGASGQKRVVYVGTAGNLSYTLADDGDEVVVTVPVAQGYHLLNVRTIYQTGTTATDLVILR